MHSRLDMLKYPKRQLVNRRTGTSTALASYLPADLALGDVDRADFLELTLPFGTEPLRVEPVGVSLHEDFRLEATWKSILPRNWGTSVRNQPKVQNNRHMSEKPQLNQTILKRSFLRR